MRSYGANKLSRWRDIRNMSQWKHRLRVTVFDENSYSEVRVFRGSIKQWSLLAFSALLGVVLFTYSVIGLTPLREWVVPGYIAEETRVDMRHTRLLVDSLSQLLSQQEGALLALRHALSGDSAAMAYLSEATFPLDWDSTNVFLMDSALLTTGENEAALRGRIQSEDRFVLQRKKGGSHSSQTGFAYSPVVGGLSDELDLGVGHLGVDLVAPAGSAVRAVDDGSVLFSSYTVETGYTLLIQHRGDRVSVYKHCSSLLKQQGDLVVGGEAVGLIGNTGALSDGPHLHFEWWVRGRPVDPQPWLGFVGNQTGR